MVQMLCGQMVQYCDESWNVKDMIAGLCYVHDMIAGLCYVTDMIAGLCYVNDMIAGYQYVDDMLDEFWNVVVMINADVWSKYL